MLIMIMPGTRAMLSALPVGLLIGDPGADGHHQRCDNKAL